MNIPNQSNFLFLGIWNHYYSSINNKLLTNALIKSSLTKFWNEIMYNIGNNMVLILLKIEYSDDTIITLSNIQKVNKHEFNLLFENFKNILNWKSEDYKIREIKTLIFSYKIIPGEFLFKNKSRITNNNKNININKLTYSNSFILPFILNILDINVPEGSENLTNYAFGVMTMSLIALLCFMNVLGYFLSLHILDKYNIVNRFPRLNKIKTYYEKTTIIFIIFESLFCISILLFLILSAYLYLKSVIIT